MWLAPLLVVGQLVLPSGSILVDLNNHEWILYREGKEVARGEANGGRFVCPEPELRNHICRTPVGTFKIERKFGARKRSDQYPLDCANKKKCGARMPYAMRFHYSGASIHGRMEGLTHKNESHGCVRVSVKDARFLSSQLQVGSEVIILPYNKR